MLTASSVRVKLKKVKKEIACSSETPLFFVANMQKEDRYLCTCFMLPQVLMLWVDKFVA
jgi:hypothetical protein